MKNTGTLKLEIIKPTVRSWEDCGDRLHALARALTPALNATMRDLYVDAQQQIANVRAGKSTKADTAWQGRNAVRVLQQHMANELGRKYAYDQKAYSTGKLAREPSASSFIPITSEIADETTALLLLSRFTGTHLKDLIACRASFPSWSGEQALYVTGRTCVVSGSADAARLRLPLWGSGPKKGETFVVAPVGGSARALWRRLVRDFARRDEIVAIETAQKSAAKEANQLRRQITDIEKNGGEVSAELRRQVQDAIDEQLRCALKLEEMGACKLGRVGWKYNSRRGKWFALISWTEYSSDAANDGDQTAAINYGANVFAQALAEDGSRWDDKGGDIRVTRERFAARRWSIQKSLRRHGRGSRGHGKNRRMLPITKLADAERRWMQSRMRMHAADLIKWCVKNKVSKIVLLDLSGQREAFEKQTKEQAHEQIKRYIHSWPWYEARCYVERQATEFGIKVVLRDPTEADSSTCPDCGHVARENVQMIDRGGEYLPPTGDGRVFREVRRETRFLCAVCGTKGLGDLVTCANMLREVGAKNPLGKMQDKSRVRAKSGLKEVKARKDPPADAAE